VIVVLLVVVTSSVFVFHVPGLENDVPTAFLDE
jgi:hypothetical protein